MLLLGDSSSELQELGQMSFVATHMLCCTRRLQKESLASRQAHQAKD